MGEKNKNVTFITTECKSTKYSNLSSGELFELFFDDMFLTYTKEDMYNNSLLPENIIPGRF